MSSTTIRYRKAEFVANDLPIELWMLEVAHHVGADRAAEPWLEELKEAWRLQATSGFGFGPSPDLDRFLTTGDRQKRLEHYFRNALESLSKLPGVVTPDELSDFGVGGEDANYTQGLPTQMVIDVGKQFLALID